MSRVRRFLLNAALVAASCLFTFLVLNLIANVTLPRLIRQDLYPRGMLNSIGHFYHTFYAATYDKNPEKWQAVLGDSHAAGEGDAFRDGKKNYSVAHLLREQDARSYFIFGRSGYGSINATRGFLRTMQESQRSVFMPRLTTPERFVFLFYEGNDLDNNHAHLQRATSGPGGIRAFVRDQLHRPPTMERLIDYYLPLTRFIFPVATRDLVKTAFGELLGGRETTPRPPIMNSLELTGARVDIATPVQGASLELTPEESFDALQVFFECLQFLAETYPTSRIEIVYIPSPATVYSWREPITLQIYHPGRGKTSTTNAENAARSLWIRGQIAAHAHARGYGFVDVTESMKLRATSTMLHGPRDPKHPNGTGYQVVADAILAARGYQQAALPSTR